MRPGSILALLIASLISGCSNWSGFGFDAQGPELPRLRQLLGVRPGMIIADIGAGEGELSAALAAEVGASGRIYATEIDPDRVKALRAKFAREKLGNVIVVEAAAAETRLPRECCDAVVVRRAYHHFSAPMEINGSVLAALRPGGQLAIIDLPPLWPWAPAGAPPQRKGHGVESSAVVQEVTQSGFLLVEVARDWPGPRFLGTYCALFRKPGAR